MTVVKNVLDKILYWITVVLFALLVIFVVWQVFSRQVLDSPAIWTDEATRITFVWVGLFASAFVFGERGHIAMEFLVRKYQEGAQKRVALVVQLIVMAFALSVMVWGGYRASRNAWDLDLSVLPFTFGQMYLALPITGLIIAFYSVYYLRALVTDTVPVYPDSFEEDVARVAQVDELPSDSDMLTDQDSVSDKNTAVDKRHAEGNSRSEKGK